MLGDGGESMSDLGTIRVDVAIENTALPGERRVLHGVLVDTGAELSCFPKTLLQELGIVPFKQWRFRQADGTVLERWAWGAFIHVAGTQTSDEVVFGEANDLALLGARSLEGLNLRVDPYRKMLVDAGPAPAAVAA